MFYENHQAAVTVLDVLHLTTQFPGVTQTGGRSYCAISFRKRANTVISYDGGELSLQGKSVLFVPAGQGYTRRAADEEMIVIHFCGYGISENRFYVHDVQQDQMLERLFEECLAVWNSREYGYRIKACSLLLQILYRIVCEEHQRDEITPASRAADFIRRNVGNSGFSLSEVAKELGISEPYLRRIFREVYGVSPMTYLTRIRMELACSLLESGYFTVREVARRCGYGNEKYFSTAFKSRFGCCPSHYMLARQWEV